MAGGEGGWALEFLKAVLNLAGMPVDFDGNLARSLWVDATCDLVEDGQTAACLGFSDEVLQEPSTHYVLIHAIIVMVSVVAVTSSWGRGSARLFLTGKGGVPRSGSTASLPGGLP